MRTKGKKELESVEGPTEIYSACARFCYHKAEGSGGRPPVITQDQKGHRLTLEQGKLIAGAGTRRQEFTGTPFKRGIVAMGDLVREGKR